MTHEMGMGYLKTSEIELIYTKYEGYQSVV